MRFSIKLKGNRKVGQESNKITGLSMMGSWGTSKNNLQATKKDVGM